MKNFLEKLPKLASFFFTSIPNKQQAAAKASQELPDLITSNEIEEAEKRLQTIKQAPGGFKAAHYWGIQIKQAKKDDPPTQAHP
jgi:hypothetical protein